MPTSFNSLEEKLETRAKAVLDADATFSAYSITVSKGEDDDELALPRCIVTCASGEESIPGLGNFNCELTVRLIESMDDTELATHQARVAVMRDLFMDDGLAATLTDETEDVTVFGVSGRRFEKAVEERAWVAEVSLELLAAPSNIS